MWVNSNVQTESLFQESKFTNPWRSKKEKHKGMFFIIPTIFSSTNCCKQMKTDSEEYYSQICQTIVFQIWFCHIENHTCSNCENGSFLSNNILFQSHLQRIAPSFLNLSPLFLFHILKHKLCHFSHKTQLHYLFFLLIEILPSLILTIQFLKILWYLPYTMQAQLTKIWRIASNRQ